MRMCAAGRLHTLILDRNTQLEEAPKAKGIVVGLTLFSGTEQQVSRRSLALPRIARV